MLYVRNFDGVKGCEITLPDNFKIFLNLNEKLKNSLYFDLIKPYLSQ